ncbi:MAG: hypothetical protein ACE147_00615 [Candidatus Methylomirabilales bacterium]
MPDDPIRERILQHCEASLALIDGASAYHHALAAVHRGAPPAPEDLTQLPAVWLQEGDEDEPPEDNWLLTWELPLTVDGWCRAADGANLPTLANRLLADMERALMVDQTRGGLARRTRITGRSITVDAVPGTMASARLQAVITYHTRRGDPANAG